MSRPGLGSGEREADVGASSPFPRFVWLFIALALLALPIFAHGCHGDDVDHEPLLIPLRLNPDER
jgi:hypothetical protein